MPGFGHNGYRTTRFYSIGFPSEWGVDPNSAITEFVEFKVSIQLVSPASGEMCVDLGGLFGLPVSIQLVSPASGEFAIGGSFVSAAFVSIQLVSPASGEKQR